MAGRAQRDGPARELAAGRDVVDVMLRDVAARAADGAGDLTCGAAALEGVDFIGIEREADYLAIAEARIEFWRGYEGTEKAADALASDAKEKPHRDAGQLTLG